MKNSSITIMVPAYNEEGNLKDTISEIILGLKGNQEKDYEIIIFDDGSTDNTGKIADKLVKENSKLRVVHNKPNKGTGYCYHKGVELAKNAYYLYIPGDNQYPASAFKGSLNLLGKSDIIVPYPKNMNIRPILRQVISYSFTNLVNFIFGLSMTYYNSQVIHKTAILKGIPLETKGFAYQAVILVRLIKGGASYVEYGYDMTERKFGSTAAFRPKNVLSVIWALLSLFIELQIFRRTPVSLAVKQMFSLKTKSNGKK